MAARPQAAGSAEEIEIDQPSAPPEHARAGWGRPDWLILAGVVAIAAIVRIVSLGRPVGLVFDEIFYAVDGCFYVEGNPDVCGVSELTARTHPPLGKWIIGAGIKLFGFDEFGWRITAAIAGTLTVAIVVVLAWRLLRPIVPPLAARLGAAAAGLLLAVDFLSIVQSRVAMLDIFVAMFDAAAILSVVLDRDRTRAAEGQTTMIDRLTLGRPWRFAAGASLGAATAVKWSGAYAALAVVLLVAAWEIAARLDERGLGSAIRRAVRAELPRSLVLLGVVPLAVYMASYIGRMPGDVIGLPWQAGTFWNNWWTHQRAMLDFHTNLSGHHPYESPPWSWLLLKRPVAYFFTDAGGAYREILALGNPVTWWPGALALLGGIGLFNVGRASLPRKLLKRPEPVLLIGALATYGPWLVLSGSRSQVFLWYLLPTIPFLCIALALAAIWAWQWTAGRVATGVLAVAIVASVAWFGPLVVALPLDPDGWRSRILFTDCARPDGSSQELPDDQTSSGMPPVGWCWI